MKICFACRATFSDSGWACPACRAAPEIIDGYYAFSPELSRANSGFNVDSFAKLFTLESGNFWFRSRNRLIGWALTKYFPEAVTFLEVGCGTGFVLSEIEKTFPNMRLAGSDIYTNGLGFASSRIRRAQLFQMDARRIPFVDEFDVIGCFDVLEHIQEDEAVLAQLHQALHPGGGLLLTVPQHRFLWSHRDEHSFHVRRYSSGEMALKLRKAGFSIIRTTSFVSLLFPLMLISRLRMKRHPVQTDPFAEFNISTTLNSFFEGILSLERYLIRLGWSFPCGGSLLVIARRQ